MYACQSNTLSNLFSSRGNDSQQVFTPWPPTSRKDYHMLSKNHKSFVIAQQTSLRSEIHRRNVHYTNPHTRLGPHHLPPLTSNPPTFITISLIQVTTRNPNSKASLRENSSGYSDSAAKR